MTDIVILEKARQILQKHHDWHLNQTYEQDLGEGIVIIPANEYGDSRIYEETVDILDLLNNEIRQRTSGS